MFANGSVYCLEAVATGGATIVVDENGIYANWEGTGFSYTETRLDKPGAEYLVTIGNADIDVHDTIHLKSVRFEANATLPPSHLITNRIRYQRAPTHIPCSLNKPGQTLQMMPNVFWANALPDADVTTDLTIHGSPLTTTDGVGYYEETWGDAPLLGSVYTWCWGHGSVGPNSITLVRCRRSCHDRACLGLCGQRRPSTGD